MGGGRIELILNNVLLALQVCLAIWQLMKLTLLRALIQGVVGWLLRPLQLSQTDYSRLQHCGGRVFKRANCFVLQADIPSERKGIEANEADRLDTIRGWYLGRRFLLEKRGSERNMLFINGKMRYYITPTIWNELLTFGEVLLCDVPGPKGAATVDACADVAAAAAAARVAIAPHYSSTVFVKGYRRCWEEVMPGGVMPFELFVKGYRRCWKGVTTGGVMTFDEVVDGIILHNQHVSVCFNDHRFLPNNLSVSEEQFLHFFNLAGLFLHAKVHWLIPTSMSFLISASMEFSPALRVWFYTLMNMWFCYIMQFKPSHHIELKSSAITLAIITAGAKVEKGATLVPWLHVANEENTPEKQFRWNSNGITCNYVVGVNKCHIRAPTIRTFSVECNSTDDFRHIITLVSCIERNQCRSLNSWDGPNNKVFVRGLKESVLAYVKNGCPPVYELVLNVDELVPNVVVT